MNEGSESPVDDSSVSDSPAPPNEPASWWQASPVQVVLVVVLFGVAGGIVLLRGNDDDETPKGAADRPRIADDDGPARAGERRDAAHGAVGAGGRAETARVVPGVVEAPAQPAVVDWRDEDDLREVTLDEAALAAGWEAGVALLVHEAPTDREMHRSLLFRELVRQSILIAARDELDLPTRDRTLHEPLPAHEGERGPLGVVVTTAPPDEPFACRITLFRVEEGRPAVVWQQVLAGGSANLAEFAPVMEELARTTFADVLRGTGIEGTEHDLDPEGALAPEIEARLLVPSLVEQYAAVRALHTAQREQGESDARLAGLARGYANLASLSEFLWSASTKVFAARAMLYAERLVARSEHSAESLRVRGWVRGMIGLHALAIEDFDAARPLEQEAEPDWVALMRAYAAYEPKRIEELSREGELAAMARWLRVSAVDGTSAKEDMVARARSLLDEVPDAYAAINAAYVGSGSLGVHREMSQRPFSVFGERTYDRILNVPDFHGDLRDRATESRTAERDEGNLAPRVELFDAMRAYDDVAEPSLGVLAELLHDVALDNVQLRLDFVVNQLAVGPDSLEPLFPLVRTHRRGVLVELSASGEQLNDESRAALGRMVEPEHVRRRHLPHEMTCLAAADPPRQLPMHRLATAHADTVRLDMFDIASTFTALDDRTETALDERVPIVQRLQEASPYWPSTLVLSIEHDWEAFRDRVPEWELRFADDPVALRTLAAALLKRDEFEPAARFVQRTVELAPSHGDYRLLARIADAAGETGMWLAAMQASLEYPVTGLEHAEVNSAIARHHARWERFEEALPYAEAAADTGASWAMGTAAQVHEGLGQWERAEDYRRAISRRYENQSSAYFIWCLRTGHGDLRAAAEMARSGLPAEPDRSDGEKLLGSWIEIIVGDAARTLDDYEQLFRARHEPLHGVLAALLADELGETDRRDALLAEAIDTVGPLSKRHDHAIDGFAKLVQRDLAEEPVGDLDTRALEEVVRESPNTLPTSLWFLAGAYLGAHDREERATEYMQLSASSPVDSLPRLFARAWLHARKIEPQAERPDERPKPPSSPAPPGSRLFDEHEYAVDAVALSQDGRLAATSDREGDVLVWNTGDLALVSRLHDPLLPAGRLAFSPDGHRLAAIGLNDKETTIWNLETESLETRLVGHAEIAGPLAFSPDGSRLVIGYGRRGANDARVTDVTVWDTKTWAEMERVRIELPVLLAIGFAAEGRSLVVFAGHTSLTRSKPGDPWSQLLVFDGETLQLDETIPSPDGRAVAAGMAANGAWLVSASKGGSLLLWNFEKRRPTARLIDPGLVSSLACSSDGGRVAYGFHDGTVRLWDVATGEVEMVFDAHTEEIAPRVAFSPEGTHVVTASTDRTVRLWDLDSPALHEATPEKVLGRSLRTELNSVGMVLVHVPAGSFEMGTPETYEVPPLFKVDLDVERPLHTVEITRPFLMAAHEVTRSQFEAFAEETGHVTRTERAGFGRPNLERMGVPRQRGLNWRNPGFEQAEDHPAVHIAHEDASAYCKWLSEKEGRTYRLPTEAEWEYACRAGTSTPYSFDDDVISVAAAMNSADRTINDAYPETGFPYGPVVDGVAFTASVGSYRPNHWGLCDMHGNVWEWCSDHFDPRYYGRSPAVDPPGPDRGTGRVQRGGSFLFDYAACRSATRSYDVEASSDSGFRVLLEVED